MCNGLAPTHNPIHFGLCPAFTLMSNLPAKTLQKFHQAAIGFLALNLIYLLLYYLFLPPFNLSWVDAAGYTLLALALFGVLSYFIYKGSKILTVVLAAIYSARSLWTTYALIAGDFFPAVPYVLPCLLITVYLLGRPLWDWP